MDLDALRAFVAVAETCQFQSAGTQLGISQQGVSKRIASLERELGLRLFARSPRGAFLTLDGEVLLPRAKDILQAEARALMAVQPDRRALRVDVLNMRSGPADLLRDFHRASPGVPLEVITMFDAPTAIGAVSSGAIDATFRAAPLPGMPLPRGVVSLRVLDEPLMLLVGPEHPFAALQSVTPAELAEHPVWMPGLVTGTEWTVYYAEMTRALGITIENSGPNFGSEEMLETIAGSSTLATFAGIHTRPSGLATTEGLRLIPLRDPTPIYPHSLVWHSDNPHPALAQLRSHAETGSCGRTSEGEVWAPTTA